MGLSSAESAVRVHSLGDRRQERRGLGDLGRTADQPGSFPGGIRPLNIDPAAGVGVAALVRHHLGDYQRLLGSRIFLAGPQIDIKPLAAQYLGIALCQLLASACREGALSSDKGLVRIAWRATDDRSEPLFGLKWIESGGHAPARNDVGHRMICELLRLALDADTHLTYSPAAAVWRLTVAAGQILHRKKKAPASGCRV